MKYLFFIAILLSCQLQANDIYIRDSIELRELYLKNYPALFGDQTYALESEFIKTYKALDKKTKKRVTKLIKSLDPYIPGKFLRPLIYWKHISPNQKRLEEVLVAIQTDKLSLLRDYILIPGSKERLKALALLRELIHEPEAGASSFYSFSKNDIADKAAILSRIEEDSFFTQAMLETKLITINLNDDLQDIDSYSLDPYGLTAGNQVKILEDDLTYKKTIVEMIERSKESVLIDIFQFDDSKGGGFSKFLLNQTLNKKEGFKLLILHDYKTALNISDDMNSNFEYIKKRIGEDPKLGERVILLQSTLRDHDKKNLLNLASLNSSSDQTNLLLIDGNSPSPEALLTPKNLNGLSHSNALWIKGPAAALIQDSYLQDLRAAFINSDKKDSIDSQTQRSETLEHFKINRDLYPAMGQTVVRITEANVDGKIKNVRNTIIDQIKKASKHIYMEQFFLYDSYIVDALILKKKLTPSLKIKILLNNNENLGFNGFPNTIFIQKMKDAGIEIRTRKSHAEKILFEEESHKKISSFDGKTLILGSTNLSPDSLEGNFRELGAVVYDSREAKRFEREFEMSWANKKDVQKMNIEDFRFKLGDSFLSKLWSTFINDFAGTILRSKDEIEKRY